MFNSFDRKTQNGWVPAIWAFMITNVAMFLMYMANGIAPFGETTIFRMDLASQYSVFLAHLADIARGEGSIFYASMMGNGSNFLGNILNYLMSPFNIIAIIMGRENIASSIAIIIALKLAMCAGTFAYVSKKFAPLANIEIVAFSLMYAFSTYMTAYYWNIMWLDALYMLPLIALGLYYLVKERRFILYVVSLAYTIIVNYYLGFMICVGCVLIFALLIVYKYKWSDTIETISDGEKIPFFKRFIVNRFVLFAIASVIAGALSAIVLLPIMDCLQWTSVADSNAPQFSMLFGPLEYIANHFSYMNITEKSTADGIPSLPNVACSVMALLLIPLYFLNKNIEKKEKIISCITLHFFYFAMSVQYINYAWHAFKTPNDLPYRFSFIYTFLFVCMAMRGWTKIKGVSRKSILWCSLGAIVVLIPLCLFCSPNDNAITIVANIIFIAIYTIMLCRKNKEKTKTVGMILLVICVLAELWVPFMMRDALMPLSMTNQYQQDIDDAKAIIEAYDDDGYYRMEMLQTDVLNSPLMYDYNGSQSFSSINYYGIARLYHNLGLWSNTINAQIYYKCFPVVTNMIVGVDYLMDNSDDGISPDTNEWVQIGTTTNGYPVYASKYPTGLGFATDSDVNITWLGNNMSPEINIESFFAKSSAVGDMFKDVAPMSSTLENIEVKPIENTSKPLSQYTYEFEPKDVENVAITFSYSISEDGHYYAYAPFLGFEVSYTTKSGSEHETTKYCNTTDLGYLKAGDEVSVYFKPNATTINRADGFYKGKFSVTVVKVNTELTADAYEEIQRNGIIEVEEYSDTYIKAYINATTDFIYTTVPYDPYWTITVDGKVVDEKDIVAVGGAFTGINVEPGEHTITFEYRQYKSLVAGGIVSVMTLTAFLVLVIIEKKNRSEGFYEPVANTTVNGIVYNHGIPENVEINAEAKAEEKDLSDKDSQ